MTQETYDAIMTTIYLNIATSCINVLTMCLLIYGTVQLRKAARVYRDAATRLRNGDA